MNSSNTTTSSELEKLKKAIIERARSEAEKILEEAKKRAHEIIESTKQRKLQEIEALRKRIAMEIGYEARLAEAKIKARLIIADAKRRIFDRLREEIERLITSADENTRYESLKRLLLDALSDESLRDRKIRIYVAPRDINLIRKSIDELAIHNRVIDIKTVNIVGGVIVETEDGLVRIDNSYNVRIESILRNRAIEISKRLFTAIKGD